MPSCCVPLCTSVKNGKNDEPKCHFFSVPKDADLCSEWRKNISRKDRVLVPEKDYVCEKHFLPEEIETTFNTTIGGQIIGIPRDRAKLAKGAVPSIFPGYPKYMTKTKHKRKPPKKRDANVVSVINKRKKTGSESIENIPIPPQVEQDQLCDNESSPSNDMMTSFKAETEDFSNTLPSRWSAIYISEEDASFKTQIEDLSMALPSRWSSTYISDEDAYVFLKFGECFSVEKKVVLHNKFVNDPPEYKVETFFGLIQIKSKLQSIYHVEDIPKFIVFVDCIKPCPTTTTFNQEDCLGLMNSNRMVRCTRCSEKIYHQKAKEKRRILSLEKKQMKNLKNKNAVRR